MKKYKKSFKTKKKRKPLNVKMILIVLAFLVVSSGLVYLLFLSSVFKIKKVEVFGTEKIANIEIKNLISENINKNIFLVDLNSIKDYLAKQYPEIARINIRRKLPDTIFAEIEERKPAAVLVKNGYFILDKQGIAFEKTLDNSLNLPEIIKQDYFNIELGQKAVDRIEDILKITKRIKTRQVVIVSEKRLNIKTADGFDAYFSLEKDIDWQIEQLEILLQEKIPLDERNDIEYIDLRFDKIYIKRSN